MFGRNGGCVLHAASYFYFSCGKVDACFTSYIGSQNRLLGVCPLLVGETGTFHQGHLGVRHTVSQRQTNRVGGRSDISNFSPKEVATFISSHFVIFRLFALVFLYLERAVFYALGIGNRVVSVDIYVGMLVFPVDVVGRIPLVLGFIEGVLYIVGTVAAHFQCARVVTLIIYDIDSHLVAITEPIVVYSGNGKLLNVS